MEEKLINKSENKSLKCFNFMKNTITIFQFVQIIFSMLTLLLLIIMGIVIYKFIENIKQNMISEFINIKNDINTAISFIENIPQNISKIVTGGISNIHI